MKKLAILAALGLSACGASLGPGTGSTGNTPASNGPNTCNAAAYQELVGQDSVVTLQIPDPKREYRTDEVVTSDFDPKRVNILLDETDVILSITCG